MNELVRALQLLATDSNRHRGKQERKEQRSAFRDIIRTVEEGERPAERLKFGGKLVTFRGWSMYFIQHRLCRCAFVMND
jgi:Interferon-related developmental regulator (IFRD)